MVQGAKGPIKLVKSDKMVGIRRHPGARSLGRSIDSDSQRVVLPNLGGFEVLALISDANKALDNLRKQEDVEVGTHVYMVEGSDQPLVPNGDIIVLFAIGLTEPEQHKILAAQHLVVKERIDDRQIIARTTPQSPNPIKVAAALYADDRILWAEPDLDGIPQSYFSPPPALTRGYMWQLENKGTVPDNPGYRLKPGADARVFEAWKRLGNAGSSSVILAVLDIGFDLEHPDLKGKVVKPFDFWSGSGELLTGDPSFTHGTPCASVAIAPTTGGSGFLLGAAPNARFMPLSGTSYSLEGTRQMFDYVILNGADIVSCSWGTADPNYAPNNLKHAAISKAAREGRGGKGCIICFAAGNEGLDYVNYYGQNADVIVVGACTSQDEHADYSNMGPELTVVAPSNGWWPILAARPSWDTGIPGQQGASRWYMDGIDRGSRFQHFGGTSSATPLVAGICALILSAHPSLKASEVKDILCKTADKIGRASDYDSRGFSRKFGYGRVNADKAVAEALRRKNGTTTVPATPPKPTTPGTTSTGTTTTTKPMESGLFKFEVETGPRSGFGVQIGNFASYGNVLVQVERLRRQFKHPTYVHINQFNGQTVYRVIVGAFSRSTDASVLLQTMRNAGVNGFVQDYSKLK